MPKSQILNFVTPESQADPKSDDEEPMNDGLIIIFQKKVGRPDGQPTKTTAIKSDPTPRHFDARRCPRILAVRDASGDVDVE